MRCRRWVWARGFFVASSGTITDEVIAHYIEMQDQMDRGKDDAFFIGDNA